MVQVNIDRINQVDQSLLINSRSRFYDLTQKAYIIRFLIVLLANSLAIDFYFQNIDEYFLGYSFKIRTRALAIFIILALTSYLSFSFSSVILLNWLNSKFSRLSTIQKMNRSAFNRAQLPFLFSINEMTPTNPSNLYVAPHETDKIISSIEIDSSSFKRTDLVGVNDHGAFYSIIFMNSVSLMRKPLSVWVLKEDCVGVNFFSRFLKMNLNTKSKNVT